MASKSHSFYSAETEVCNTWTKKSAEVCGRLQYWKLYKEIEPKFNQQAKLLLESPKTHLAADRFQHAQRREHLGSKWSRKSNLLCKPPREDISAWFDKWRHEGILYKINKADLDV